MEREWGWCASRGHSLCWAGPLGESGYLEKAREAGSGEEGYPVSWGSNEVAERQSPQCRKLESRGKLWQRLRRGTVVTLSALCTSHCGGMYHNEPDKTWTPALRKRVGLSSQ